MNILVSILTSGKLDKLERCINSALAQISGSNVLVVINSLDEAHQGDAIALAARCNVKSIVTESNGKPGKGKNALISTFLDTEFTHVVPVDGDDVLLPDAISILTSLIESRNPDVVGLIDGLTLLNGNLQSVEDWLKTEVYANRVTVNIDPKHFKKFNLHLAKIRRAAVEYDNLHNRFVLLSKRAAEAIDYDEELCGAEDIKQGLFLKLLHQRGVLNYLLLSSQRVYLYDVTSEGVFFNVLCKSDPDFEMDHFWSGLSKEQVAEIRAIQLERVYE